MRPRPQMRSCTIAYPLLSPDPIPTQTPKHIQNCGELAPQLRWGGGVVGLAYRRKGGADRFSSTEPSYNATAPPNELHNRIPPSTSEPPFHTDAKKNSKLRAWNHLDEIPYIGETATIWCATLPTAELGENHRLEIIHHEKKLELHPGFRACQEEEDRVPD